MDEPFEELPSAPEHHSAEQPISAPDGSIGNDVEWPGQEVAAESPRLEREQPEPTGHPTVDAVLTSLGQLDETPVSEHVAVFEHAHEQLRGALSGAGDHAVAGSASDPTQRPSYAGPRPRQG